MDRFIKILSWIITPIFWIMIGMFGCVIILGIPTCLILNLTTDIFGSDMYKILNIVFGTLTCVEVAFLIAMTYFWLEDRREGDYYCGW